METETITRAELEARIRAAKARRESGPVIIYEMTPEEREAFKVDISEIRRRGMYGSKDRFR